jgi:hypothetical protein
MRTVMVRFVRSMSTQAEIAGFGYPQTMPVDQEANQPIAPAISVLFERGEELLDLGLGQVLPDPIDLVALSAPRLVALRCFLHCLIGATFADISGLLEMKPVA